MEKGEKKERAGKISFNTHFFCLFCFVLFVLFCFVLFVFLINRWSDVNCFVDTRSVVFEFGTDPQVYEKKEVEEVEVVVEEEVEREEL